MLGVATLVLLLLGAFAGTFHFALVPHEMCPEHGEPVEVGNDLPVGSPAPAPVGHDHHHCSLAGAAGFLSDPGPRVGDALAVAAPLVPPAARSLSCRPIPPIFLAPKASPPA